MTVSFQRYDCFNFAFFFFSSVDTTQKAHCHSLRISSRTSRKADASRSSYLGNILLFIGHHRIACVRCLTIDGRGPKNFLPFFFFFFFLRCPLFCFSHSLPKSFRLPPIHSLHCTQLFSVICHLSTTVQDKTPTASDRVHSTECSLVATCLGIAHTLSTYMSHPRCWM